MYCTSTNMFMYKVINANLLVNPLLVTWLAEYQVDLESDWGAFSLSKNEKFQSVTKLCPGGSFPTKQPTLAASVVCLLPSWPQSSDLNWSIRLLQIKASNLGTCRTAVLAQQQRPSGQSWKLKRKVPFSLTYLGEKKSFFSLKVI